ncbi:hypothetical protein J6590_066432 [Homalodisca vitripennis]|nr:hypothetical protein J6590_066432 [Homalodisca vitripennis]
MTRCPVVCVCACESGLYLCSCTCLAQGRTESPGAPGHRGSNLVGENSGVVVNFTGLRMQNLKRTLLGSN